MKIICDRQLAMRWRRFQSRHKRSSIPVLEGILMKAEGFSLTLTGYDLEMGITTNIEANVLEPGEWCSGAALGDMVRRLSTRWRSPHPDNHHHQGRHHRIRHHGHEPGRFPRAPTGADHTLDLDRPRSAWWRRRCSPCAG